VVPLVVPAGAGPGGEVRGAAALPWAERSGSDQLVRAVELTVAAPREPDQGQAGPSSG
jgi:hypothetical protein